ncbi:hypothetical protein C3941_10585 [Kaistia algarum]|nr:hypothetical protein C3941_10585 [Kaistia algarum]
MTADIMCQAAALEIVAGHRPDLVSDEAEAMRGGKDDDHPFTLGLYLDPHPETSLAGSSAIIRSLRSCQPPTCSNSPSVVAPTDNEGSGGGHRIGSTPNKALDGSGKRGAVQATEQQPDMDG